MVGRPRRQRPPTDEAPLPSSSSSSSSSSSPSSSPSSSSLSSSPTPTKLPPSMAKPSSPSSSPASPSPPKGKSKKPPPTTVAASIPLPPRRRSQNSRQPKILCLGMSFPHLAEHMIEEGIAPAVQKHILQFDSLPPPPPRRNNNHKNKNNHHPKEDDGANNPVLQQSIQCVQRNILTEMDARDYLRVRQMEQDCQVRAYTVSQERGALYDATRHLHANFNRTSSFMYQLRRMLHQANEDQSNGNGSGDRRNRHLSASSASTDSAASSVLAFRQIILDYYWIPKGTWCMEHWSKEFFSKTLPALVQANMLQYDCPHVRQAQHAHQPPRKYTKRATAATAGTANNNNNDSNSNNNKDDDRKMPAINTSTATPGKASKSALAAAAASNALPPPPLVRKHVNYDQELGIGCIYLPFCYHVVKELVAAIQVLSRYFEISFLLGTQLSEHALWRSTQDLPPEKMQRVFGKQLNQEDLYCTFGPRDVFECMEDTRVSKVQVIEILSRIEDFAHVRMVKLQVLRPIHQHQPGRGGFVGLQPHAQCVQRGFLQLMGLDDSSFSLTAMAALNISHSSSSSKKKQLQYQQQQQQQGPISTARFLQQCLGKGGRIRRGALPAMAAAASSATTAAAAATTATTAMVKRGPGRPPSLVQQQREKRKRVTNKAKQQQQPKEEESYHYIVGPVKNLQTYLRITKDPKKNGNDDDDDSDQSDDDDDENDDEEDENDDDDEEENVEQHHRECMCAGCSDESRQVTWVSGLLWGTKYQKQVEDKYIEEVHDEEMAQANAAKLQLVRKKGAYKRKKRGKRRKLEDPAVEIDEAWMNNSRVGYKVKSTLPLSASTSKRSTASRNTAAVRYSEQEEENSDDDESSASPYSAFGQDEWATHSRVCELREASHAITDKYLRHESRRVSLSPASKTEDDVLNHTHHNNQNGSASSVCSNSSSTSTTMKLKDVSMMIESTPCTTANDPTAVARVSPTSVLGTDAMVEGSSEISLEDVVAEGARSMEEMLAAGLSGGFCPEDEVATAIAIASSMDSLDSDCKLSMLAGMAVERDAIHEASSLPQQPPATPTVKVKRPYRRRQSNAASADNKKTGRRLRSHALQNAAMPPCGVDLNGFDIRARHFVHESAPRVAPIPCHDNYEMVQINYNMAQTNYDMARTPSRKYYVINTHTRASFQFLTRDGQEQLYASDRCVTVSERTTFHSIERLTRYVVEGVNELYVAQHWLLPALHNAAMAEAGQLHDLAWIPKAVCLFYGAGLYTHITILDGNLDYVMNIQLDVQGMREEMTFEEPDTVVFPRNFVVTATFQREGWQLPEADCLEPPRFVKMHAKPFVNAASVVRANQLFNY